VVVNNSQLDDMVLLRSDGTPTYMLAVVVDDHDMNITHIIRGDDHLNNAARQAQIYKAMGWDIPKFAHIPLIHGPDGAKLSKRHGALGIDEYRKMGYLEEALRNYLLRLGWSHGNDELISSAQAIEWFNLESVGKAPSRIDFKKMENLNSHYIKSAENDRLLKLVVPFIEQNLNSQISEQSLLYIKAGMDGLKTRAKTILELAKLAEFYVQMLEFTPEAKVELQKMDKKLVSALLAELQSLEIWDEDGIKQVMHHLAEVHNVKIGEIAQILRIALTYSTISPSVNEIMLVLGKEESLQRLEQLL
jgi:glutamyl-tRNA synthetase